MTETQKRLIRVLQHGIPLSVEPFRDIAQQVGTSEDDVLEQLRAWKSDGTIRRFGAILRHHKAGYTANAMVVWDVPDELAATFGETAAQRASVSHCYQRPRFEGFSYNLYTMIHGRSRKECEETVRAISRATAIDSYRVLYTTAEFKKSSPAYFLDETGSGDGRGSHK